MQSYESLLTDTPFNKEIRERLVLIYRAWELGDDNVIDLFARYSEGMDSDDAIRFEMEAVFDRISEDEDEDLQTWQWQSTLVNYGRRLHEELYKEADMVNVYGRFGAEDRSQAIKEQKERKMNEKKARIREMTVDLRAGEGSQLTGPQLIEVHNLIVEVFGVGTEVKRFASRGDGIRRVQKLLGTVNLEPEEVVVITPEKIITPESTTRKRTKKVKDKKPEGWSKLSKLRSALESHPDGITTKELAERSGFVEKAIPAAIRRLVNPKRTKNPILKPLKDGDNWTLPVV